MIFWVIEDHELIFQALRSQLQIVFEKTEFRYERDPDIAVLKAIQKPDCIIFDLNLGRGPRFDLLQELIAEFTPVPVVVLSGTIDPVSIDRIKRLGANAFIEKGQSSTRLISAFREVLINKKRVFPNSNELKAKRRFPTVLTSRENQVLNCLLKGLTNRRIGKELGIKEKTVRAHLTAVYRKLGVSNRTEALLSMYDSA